MRKKEYYGVAFKKKDKNLGWFDISPELHVFETEEMRDSWVGRTAPVGKRSENPRMAIPDKHAYLALSNPNCRLCPVRHSMLKTAGA